ncbi:IPT/TIG domain-containing protein [Streptomyces sp. C10]|uniref:IPT/TIG domain-containing protein n=1 Tax=Streptomyces sp. C10 TaxID=531941 RepID=UPI0039817A40
MTIDGSRFSADRDADHVVIGDVPALVLEAAPDRLTALVGENAESGPVQVTVNGVTATASEAFKLLDRPDPAAFGHEGPPVFFHGPQEGTPQVGVEDQPVLVCFCFPQDHDPGGAAARQNLRTSEISGFDDANRFWKESSYTPASPNATSWKYTFTDWLDLPDNRIDYVWQQEDIAEARRALFRGTRRSSAVSGTTLYSGHLGGVLSCVDAGNAASPIERSEVVTASLVTGVHVVGTRVYLSAGTDGLQVLDATAPLTPTLLTRVPFAGWLNDLDADGNILVAAAVESGILVYDLSNPDSPAQVGGLSFAGMWATAVKVVGTRAYVAVGETLRVVDLSNPSAPVALASAGTTAWATDIDVEGTLCAVTTDGDGLHLYDVTGATLVQTAALRSALRIHAVSLLGGFAHLAATEAGLRVVDVSAPASPLDVANIATAAPAFDVVTEAGRAYISLGADRIAVVDISTPSAPAVLGTADLATVPEPDLPGLRNALTVAINSQNLRKGFRLLVHAFQRAEAAGFDLGDFQGLVVVLNGPFLRGQSWTTDHVQSDGVTVTLDGTKGIIYLATGAHWGRKAHEMGHWLEMQDIYEEWHDDGTFTPGTAAPWCMGGNHDKGPLFSGYQIHEHMRFYNTGVPNANVVERVWSPTATELNETFDIVAHDASEDTTSARIHLLKLVVAKGLVYFVEVRQKPGSVIFDQNIPAANPEQGLVVVTRATQGTTISNTQERPIMLFGALDVGQQVVDAARRLTIKVEAKVRDRPLTYRVRLHWNQPVTGDPAGQFDLSITPWSTDTWETVDIWVDSPRNNGATQRYEFHEPGDESKPILNGDRPWVHHPNKIYARVRNTGVVDVNDVFVTFYVNSPPGIGDNGNWFPIGTKHVPVIPKPDPAVPGSGEAIVEHDWIPERTAHTCIKVAVLPQTGEIEVNNNLAQENVAVFDSAASSSHQPVVLEAEVRSPFSVWRRVDLVVRGLPQGWHAAVDKSWCWLSPRGVAPLRAVVWTDAGTPAGGTQRIPPLALARVEGWTDFDHRYLPIGGILAAVKAVQRVEPICAVAVEGNRLTARGCLKPPLNGVPVTVEIVDAEGHAQHFLLSTDERGCFDLAEQKVLLRRGRHRVQVHVTAGGAAAETSCEPIIVEVA